MFEWDADTGYSFCKLPDDLPFEEFCRYIRRLKFPYQNKKYNDWTEIDWKDYQNHKVRIMITGYLERTPYEEWNDADYRMLWHIQNGTDFWASEEKRKAIIKGRSKYIPEPRTKPDIYNEQPVYLRKFADTGYKAMAIPRDILSGEYNYVNYMHEHWPNEFSTKPIKDWSPTDYKDAQNWNTYWNILLYLRGKALTIEENLWTERDSCLFGHICSGVDFWESADRQAELVAQYPSDSVINVPFSTCLITNTDAVGFISNYFS